MESIFPTEIIQNYPTELTTPTNISVLTSLLALTAWFTYFIKNYTSIIVNLTLPSILLFHWEVRYSNTLHQSKINLLNWKVFEEYQFEHHEQLDTLIIWSNLNQPLIHITIKSLLSYYTKIQTGNDYHHNPNQRCSPSPKGDNYSIVISNPTHTTFCSNPRSSIFKLQLTLRIFILETHHKPDHIIHSI